MLYQADLVDAALSELYHANSTEPGDDSTAYDALGRLTGFAQGVLSASGNNGTTLDTVASPSQTQSWQLDALGNATGVTTNSTTQTQTSNAQNQLTGVGTATLDYDASGNLTTDETGQELVYDAWNRLVGVKDSSGNTLETDTYDALGRRITVTQGSSSPATGAYSQLFDTTAVGDLPTGWVNDANASVQADGFESVPQRADDGPGTFEPRLGLPGHARLGRWEQHLRDVVGVWRGI